MEYHLKTPVPEAEIRRLKMGDLIYVTGTIITARDEAHLKALELHEKGEAPPVDFGGVGIFHCGPIMQKVDGDWTVVAAGPTTSARMEIFQDKFIEAFRPAVIIGKGGMGDRTAKACQDFGCVYGAFTGGAALLAARGIKKVKDVFWLEELGMPECLWVYKTEDFGPMIVTIDTHGNNMTQNVDKQVRARMDKILTEMEG
ncbi:MAG: FumA C-terminus/TtdB family hydratase beta subunit [Candidatus Bathyarchaeota archaeon]|nr:FumA C-terminus/TtdB family hydratase beta subunit [Candidatus Bathyarchaeota archaeon]MDH5790883.1 FumA C-terminus/TtdB family hydratase beta subunit [Candidatus Bathyarchaeota archaeon]